MSDAQLRARLAKFLQDAAVLAVVSRVAYHRAGRDLIAVEHPTTLHGEQAASTGSDAFTEAASYVSGDVDVLLIPSGSIHAVIVRVDGERTLVFDLARIDKCSALAGLGRRLGKDLVAIEGG